MRRRRLLVVLSILIFPSLVLIAFNAIQAVSGDSDSTQVSTSQIGVPIPSEPPVADKISFGPLDGLGESTIVGEEGAVLSSGHVLIVNLDSTHQAYTQSAADGSFNAKIFAPPGSNIMVKHAPLDHRFWHLDPWDGIEDGSFGLENSYPSTTIYRPYEHGAGPDMLPFAAVGAIDIDTESFPRTIGAAWSITGTVGPISDLTPGDMITVDGTVRLYSQAISITTDVAAITLTSQFEDAAPWLMIFDDAGVAVPYINQAGSRRLTPTGFPILEGSRNEV